MNTSIAGQADPRALRVNRKAAAELRVCYSQAICPAAILQANSLALLVSRKVAA